jgi:hypothetical protein
VQRIACLHTADSNIRIFDTCLRELGQIEIELRHSVRADLLTAAEQAGGLTSVIVEQTSVALLALCNDADAVLLTCSTLGPIAEVVAETAPIPVLRADTALANEAVKEGGKVIVLCAAETTRGPTQILFEKAARETGAKITVQLVQGAWEIFKAGDHDRYLFMIAQAAIEAAQDGACRIALAQASMSDAAGLVYAERRPLTSPMVALKAAVETLSNLKRPHSR